MICVHQRGSVTPPPQRSDVESSVFVSPKKRFPYFILMLCFVQFPALPPSLFVLIKSVEEEVSGQTVYVSVRVITVLAYANRLVLLLLLPVLLCVPY